MKKNQAVGYIMEYEQGSLSGLKTLEMFSHLIKTGLINGLQGSYGRTARALVEDNWLKKDGSINQVKVRENGIR